MKFPTTAFIFLPFPTDAYVCASSLAHRTRISVLYCVSLPVLLYTGCIKKLNRYEFALNFAKQLLISSFLYLLLPWVLIMQNNEKKCSNSNYVNHGGGGGGSIFPNKLKMACARNLKALIIFRVNRWKRCWAFNYCTKFQTICFSLSPLTIHFSLKNQPFACSINAST